MYTFCSEIGMHMMTYDVESQTVYRTAEVSERLGVSRQTLLRWFHERRGDDVPRNHRGWREFSDEDIRRISEQVEGGKG